MQKIEMGKTLRQAREQVSMPVQDVINRLSELGIEISDKALYNYEKGHRTPDVDTLMALCRIYGIEDILGVFGYNKEAPASPQGLSGDETELLRYYGLSSPDGQRLIRDFATYTAHAAKTGYFDPRIPAEERVLADLRRAASSHSPASTREVGEV